MTDSEKFNEVYLNLELRKSAGKTDENGNYIFEVEASNENLDLQNQIVLQNALMESKDEFLRGGVISFDHLHKRKDADGNVISDPSMVIGEPIDVKFDETTKSTVVTGKLYSTNEKARELIKMLKAGSTRVRASVGGIFPEVIKNVRTGVEKITHVLWNDLALTTSPVNNTVGAAVFAKSMTASEFVNYLPIEMKKSLCAGYGTDSSEMTGGRTLIPEDTSTKAIDTTNETQLNAAIRDVANLLKNGQIAGEEAAIAYLVSQGIDYETSRDIIREMIFQGGQMMKKSFSNAVSALYKSLVGGNQNDDEDEINKANAANADNDDINIEDEDDDDNGEGDDDNDTDGYEDNGNDDGENGDDSDDEGDDDEAVSGEEVLKSLDYELKTMRKSLKSNQKQLNDLGEAVTTLAQMVHAIGSEKLPPKSVLNKSMNGNNQNPNALPRAGRPTEDDLYRVQCVLQKCVQEGRLDMQKSSMISSDMQKCMYTGKPMKQEYFEFLQRELNKGAN